MFMYDTSVVIQDLQMVRISLCINMHQILVDLQLLELPPSPLQHRPLLRKLSYQALRSDLSDLKVVQKEMVAQTGVCLYVNIVYCISLPISSSNKVNSLVRQDLKN